LHRQERIEPSKIEDQLAKLLAGPQVDLPSSTGRGSC
jgi:hypothetical protein